MIVVEDPILKNTKAITQVVDMPKNISVKNEKKLKTYLESVKKDDDPKSNTAKTGKGNKKP